MIKTKAKIILASNSRARNEMLQNVGLEFIKIPADIDEDAIIKTMQEAPKEISLELSKQKCLHVSSQNPNAYVIGSDQILEQGGQIYQKASDMDEARDKLKALRGKTHHLISSVAIAYNGKIIWQNTDTAEMNMHDFDDDFLEQYLTIAKNDILSCVGAYAFENHGAWLFQSINANYFTILGMPLLPLLEFLKTGTQNS